MKKIYEAVAFGIVAVYELNDMIYNERIQEKKEELKAVRFAYYYLIKQLNEQFGCTRINVCDALLEIGYTRREAIAILNYYEYWASHVVPKLEDNL